MKTKMNLENKSNCWISGAAALLFCVTLANGARADEGAIRVEAPQDASEVRADAAFADYMVNVDKARASVLYSSAARVHARLDLERPLLDDSKKLDAFYDSADGRERIGAEARARGAPSGYMPSKGMVRNELSKMVRRDDEELARLDGESKRFEAREAEYLKQSNALREQLERAREPRATCDQAASLAVFEALKAPADVIAAVVDGDHDSLVREREALFEKLRDDVLYVGEGGSHDLQVVNDAETEFWKWRFTANTKTAARFEAQREEIYKKLDGRRARIGTLRFTIRRLQAIIDRQEGRTRCSKLAPICGAH